MVFVAAIGLAFLLLVALVLASGWASARALRRMRALERRIDHLAARVASLEPQAVPPVEAPPVPAAVETPAAAVIDPISAAAAAPASPGSYEAPPPLETPRAAGDTLEGRIGGQWLLYIGVLAILVGVAYFEKLAFESAWLGETARVLQGAVAGLLLVGAGVRFARAGYRGYGQAIAGAGIAAVYVSIYASFNYYHLIGRPAAFTLMLLVTAGGVLLAMRQDSQPLAVLAVGGGFLTPFLLPGPSAAEVALFGYDAVLVAGAGALARRRAWGLLYALSYLATLLTLATWADRFYAPHRYLVTEIFLTIFAALFVYMLVESRRSTDPATQIARLLLMTAPVAWYFASVLILFEHTTALLVWILALATLAAFLGTAVRVRWGLVAWTAAALPLVFWANTRGAQAHLATGLLATAGTYAIGLAALLQRAGRGDRAGVLELIWLHAAALVSFAAAYLLLLPNHLAITAPAAAGFAAWQGALALLTAWSRDRAPHFAALAATFVAIAVALQFDGPAVTVGWGMEGAAVVYAAWRTERDWIRAGGMILFAIAFVRAIDLLLAPALAGQSLFFNQRAACALLLIVLAYAIAWLHARRPDLRYARGFQGASVLAAQALALAWLTSEIRGYFAQQPSATAQEVVLSVTWAAYASGAILIGLWRRYAPVRVFAIGVLAVTIVKVFAIDLAHLDRIYRVLSVLGLGVLLLLTSYLYQRSRSGTPIGSAPGDDDAERAPAAPRG
jgi:uncharacterized membrane protein